MSTTKPKTTDTLIQVRVPADLKRRTAAMFEEMGTTTSAVIKMMLMQADHTHSIPFKIGDGYPIGGSEVIAEVEANSTLENMPLTQQNIEDLKNIELALATPDQIRKNIVKRIKKGQQ